MTGRSAVCLLVLIAGMVLASLPAAAHTKSRSFSSWRQQGGELVMVFSVPSLQATRLAAVDDADKLETLLNRHLDISILVHQDGALCAPLTGAQSLRARGGILRSEMRFRCPRPELTGVVLENNAFFSLTPSHIHFARIRMGGDVENPWREILFSDTARHHPFQAERTAAGAAPSWVGVLSDYTRLGVTHVLGGIDHIAFVIGLLLLCRRLRDVFITITGFTLGHSLTLALATLQLVTPHPPVVEALIGFTIALVAAEGIAIRYGIMNRILPVGFAGLAALWLASVLSGGVVPSVTWVGLIVFFACHGLLMRRVTAMGIWVPVLAVIFGLVHGFGFAGVLQEIGLPQGRLALSLFSFNVGVEIGQVLIVTLAWGIGRQVAVHFAPRHGRVMINSLGALLCGLGMFWFVGRAFA